MRFRHRRRIEHCLLTSIRKSIERFSSQSFRVDRIQVFQRCNPHLWYCEIVINRMLTFASVTRISESSRPFLSTILPDAQKVNRLVGYVIPKQENSVTSSCPYCSDAKIGNCW